MTRGNRPRPALLLLLLLPCPSQCHPSNHAANILGFAITPQTNRPPLRQLALTSSKDCDCDAILQHPRHQIQPTAIHFDVPDRRRKDEKRKPPGAASMPPWLLRYEHEELDSILSVDAFESNSLMVKDGREDRSIDNTASGGGTTVLADKMHRLRMAMSGIFSTTTSVTLSSLPLSHHKPHALGHCFTSAEIHDVLDAIRVASQDNLNLMSGCADFLYLMLSLEEQEIEEALLVGDNGEASTTEESDSVQPHPIMTREVLVAAAFHYCDCVRARKAGVYDYVRRAMEGVGVATGGSLQVEDNDYDRPRSDLMWLPPLNTVGGDNATMNHNDNEAIVLADPRDRASIDNFGEETVRIAAGAARLKRAEVMATAMNAKFESGTRSAGSAGPVRGKSTITKDASILRSFLVTLSDDWRALVIRSAACLYRLRGIVDNDNAPPGQTLAYSSTSMQTARDALRIYTPLAQRMGMQRLKSELENTAFRILYRRQYAVASALHQRDVEEMQSILEVLTSRIEQLLRSDVVLMGHLSDLSVSSRVKEPYSLWKKILRYRKQAVGADGGESKFAPTELSTKWVPDAIALRIILRGRRVPMEDEESLRMREKMLCYYALQMIRDLWPPSKSNLFKDYIKHPKRNGYQSLHYTAALVIDGVEWPFEVQIRSEEMHRVAEFGVAAHWDYKLQNKVQNTLADHPDLNAFSLPPANANEDETVTLSIANPAAGAEQISNITSRGGRIASYIEALASSRENLVQNNVFIFISSTRSALDGRIVSVNPSSCLVRDVLRQYQASLEEHIIENMLFEETILYRNGVKARLDEELCNGDVLTLPPLIMDYLAHQSSN